jgi:hypothetical protein
MTQFISPGVYVLEKDLSQYVSNLSSTIVAMVGTSDMGPSNVPTLVTSASQYVSTFGQPNPNHYLGYAVLAYLKQGTQCYVTRVAPSDAANAKLTVPLPKASTPFTGDWTLASNTATTAVFNVKNSVGATGADQLITLPSSATPVLLPNFDFQDTTNVAPLNPIAGTKLGADLKSFTGTQAHVDAYVAGRSFTVTSGYGKGSSVPVTNLSVVDPTTLALTVDAKTFAAFNSPLLATASGSLVTSAIAATWANAAVAGNITTIGTTSTGGNITLTYSGTRVTTQAALLSGLRSGDFDTTLSAVNGLLTVSAGPVVTININVPLYSSITPNSISPADALNNAILIQAILDAILFLFKTENGSSHVFGATPCAAAAAACRSNVNGIVGVGYVDPITGFSNGYKAATLEAGSNTVVLSAITLGASGNFKYTVGSGYGLTATDMGISGTFGLNLHRPTWVMSPAGASFVPTLLKFSSIGQADFSNLAITVDLTTNNLNSLNEQQYVVSVFARNTGFTVSASSVVQSDFLLIEKYTGTPEVLQSSINAGSSYIHLKVDYSTTDTVDYTTGALTHVVGGDNLNPSFGLVTNQASTGVLSGTINTIAGTTLYPSFSAFMANGTAGTNVTKFDIIGDETAKTGIYSFSDPEMLDINVLVAPGWSADPDVATAMISLCSNRADAMCILDTPYGLSVQDVIAYRNNILTSGSNYAAIYYPWVQITDSVNKKNIFVPPSGMVAGQYAYNDTVGDVFTAPAGRTRGNMLDATATERILNQGDRDALTLAQINPIYSESGYGIYIRGQMTLQRATTALNRVNVRRLLLNLRKVIATASKYFEFEPGDAVTALRLKQLAESTLEDRLRKGAIRSYTVDVGPNVNTALTLENNELRMSISIVPTKTAEIIIEVFNILPQGQGLTINNA